MIISRNYNYKYNYIGGFMKRHGNNKKLVNHKNKMEQFSKDNVLNQANIDDLVQLEILLKEKLSK